MKTARYTEERFMSILWALYSRTSHPHTVIKYGEFCKEYSISNSIFPILESHKVLKSEKVKISTRGKYAKQYVWNTIQPNIQMARKLMHEIQKYHKEANVRYKEKNETKKQEEFLSSFTESKIQQEEKIVNYDYVNSDVYHDEDELVLSIKSNENNTFTTSTLDPSNTTSLNDSTTIKDNSSLKIENKNVKKISILWGLILIQW